MPKKTKSPEQSRRIKIVPAILAHNKKEFETQWKKVSPYFSYLQIDIMDGQFVKQKNSISPDKIRYLIRAKKLEIHLMVEGISKYAAPWIKSKNVKKIIWHYEANKDLEYIQKINNFLKNKKIKTGLAINPNTSLSKIKEIIEDFDTIQVMGVTPGKQGQKFQKKVLEIIKALRYKYPNLNIEVDGGVNDKNISSIKKAGANIIAIGSYLQKSEDVNGTIKNLK